MKKLTLYAPYMIITGVILAGIYFLWYKPRKDDQDAKNAAAQAADDATLTADDPTYVKIQQLAASGTVVPGQTSLSTVFSLNH